MTKRQKSLYELQYENAKLESTVNKGTSCVLLALIGFWPLLFIFIWIFGGSK